MKLSSFVHPAAAVLVAPACVLLLHTPAHAPTASSCGGHRASIVGTRADDHLVGTAGDDVIVGGDGRDHIEGLGGNDVICGSGGNDVIDAGPGADRVHGQWGADQLAGGRGDDVLLGGVGVTTVFRSDAGDDRWASHSSRAALDLEEAPNGMTVDVAAGTAAGWGRDTFALHPWVRHGSRVLVQVSGSPYDDTLLGSSGPDVITGGTGADTIDGRGGSDELVADADPAAEITSDDSVDSLAGGEGDDYLAPGVTDTAWGGPGDDTVEVAFSDRARLTSGLTIRGGGDRDRLVLTEVGPGGDGVYRSLGLDMTSEVLTADSVSCTAAGIEDVAFGTNGRYRVTTDFDISGTSGPNRIILADLAADGTASVVAHGGAGDDEIECGSGDDTLDGGQGQDRADAQDGTDTCISIERALWTDAGTGCEVVLP